MSWIERANSVCSEGVDEVQVGVEEAGGVLELRVMADVFIQNQHSRPAD